MDSIQWSQFPSRHSFLLQKNGPDTAGEGPGAGRRQNRGSNGTTIGDDGVPGHSLL